MIKHIVWWTLHETAAGATALENAQRAKAASASLHAIPTVLSLEVSYAIQPTTTIPAQLVLQSVHTDMEALKAYAEHPLHLAFGKLIKEIAASRQALDYHIDADA